MHDDVALLSANDVPLLTSITTAQNQDQEIDDKLHVSVSSNEDSELECMSENSVSAIQVTAVLVTMRQTYTDKFCNVLQSQQKRTLRRGAFRAWGTFAVDMTTEKRLCNIVQRKKLRMLCREVFHAWRLGEKNQIEALETEIETLNERVRVLEEQKTRPLDIGYIASELAKRGLVVSNDSQTVQKTAAAQSQVTEQQETKGFFSSITGWGRSKKSTQPPVQVPQITPETKSDKGETSLDSESDKDPRSEAESEPEAEPEAEPESIEKPPQPLPLCMSKDAPLPPPPPPPPVSKDAPPPPPPPPESAKSTQQESGSPPQESGSTQSSSGKKAPSLTSMTPQEEMQLKDLKKKHKNGTLKEVAGTKQEMAVILKRLEEYEIYLDSQPRRVVQRPGTSAKALQISAEAEKKKEKEAKQSAPREMMLGEILKRTSGVRDKSSGDESSSTWSGSDDEKHSASGENESSIAVECKVNDKQETPGKEVHCGLFNVFAAMIDADDMPPADIDASANIEDDYKDLC
jgi:hypothetical protein